MKTHFADYGTSKMLKQLGFNGRCLGWYLKGDEVDYSGFVYNSETEDEDCAKPIWSQVKEWLWDKHGILVNVTHITQPHFQSYIMSTKESQGQLVGSEFTSPMTAEVEGIKWAVQYLHSKIK